MYRAQSSQDDGHRQIDQYALPILLSPGRHSYHVKHEQSGKRDDDRDDLTLGDRASEESDPNACCPHQRTR